MPAWRRMFQTITVNPSVQSPPLLRRLSGWFANKNPARVCWHCKGRLPGRGLGNPHLAKGILRGLRFADSRLGWCRRMHKPISTPTSTPVIRPSGTERDQLTPLHQPTPLRQPTALLEDMPVEPTVALLVRPIALPLIMVLPLRSMPVVRPSPLALVGSPMPLLLEHMPHNLPSRMNGTAQ